MSRSRKNRSPKSPSGRASSSRALDSHYIYGLHPVRAALDNPRRVKTRLLASKNALARLENLDQCTVPIDTCEPRELDRLVGRDAVHQGVVLQVQPLQAGVFDPDEHIDCDLVLVLDQITDPHNVGAVLRSAVALGTGLVISTSRHNAKETAVLAKSASGALDLVQWVETRNLSKSIQGLNRQGFQTIGLDSEGPEPLEHSFKGQKIALILGAEGRGLRQQTRESCGVLARLDMPGPIKSLNVSNAAALSLYLARTHLDRA